MHGVALFFSLSLVEEAADLLRLLLFGRAAAS